MVVGFGWDEHVGREQVDVFSAIAVPRFEGVSINYIEIRKECTNVRALNEFCTLTCEWEASMHAVKHRKMTHKVPQPNIFWQFLVNTLQHALRLSRNVHDHFQGNNVSSCMNTFIGTCCSGKRHLPDVRREKDLKRKGITHLARIICIVLRYRTSFDQSTEQSPFNCSLRRLSFDRFLTALGLSVQIQELEPEKHNRTIACLYMQTHGIL